MNITLFEGFRVATPFEQYAIIGVLVIAVIGLLYAAFLTRQILREPEGDEKMKHIAGAIRSGGNAYLNRQFRTILLLLIIVAIFVFVTGLFAGETSAYRNPAWLIGLGRAGGFLMGAVFSALVGYIGMNMAMQGNVRVAAGSP